jgi:hypothetical protein
VTKIALFLICVSFARGATILLTHDVVEIHTSVTIAGLGSDTAVYTGRSGMGLPDDEYRCMASVAYQVGDDVGLSSYNADVIVNAYPNGIVARAGVFPQGTWIAGIVANSRISLDQLFSVSGAGATVHLNAETLDGADFAGVTLTDLTTGDIFTSGVVALSDSHDYRLFAETFEVSIGGGGDGDGSFDVFFSDADVARVPEAGGTLLCLTGGFAFLAGIRRLLGAQRTRI